MTSSYWSKFTNRRIGRRRALIGAGGAAAAAAFLAACGGDDDDEPGQGVGFSFHEYTSEAMIEAMERAVRAYRNPERWTAIVKRGMAIDFSWEASAGKYLEIYEQAIARRVEKITI